VHEPDTGPDTAADSAADSDADIDAGNIEVSDPELTTEAAFFGTVLFTRRPFFSLSPLHVIQQPRAFIDSFINQTLNRKIPIKISGTTKVAIVIEGPITQQSSHNNPVTQTPISPCCGSEE
jgi:hypothetical protein